MKPGRVSKAKLTSAYISKQLRGCASQYSVAAELCLRNVVAVITMGNCPNTDILCSDIDGKKFVHIQVKTFVPGNATCSLGEKAEINYGDNFFWVLAGIQPAECKDPSRYYIIPSPVMAAEIARNHQTWLKTPGKNGKVHNETTFRGIELPPRKNHTGWSIEKYKNAWDLILNRLV